IFSFICLGASWYPPKRCCMGTTPPDIVTRFASCLARWPWEATELNNAPHPGPISVGTRRQTGPMVAGRRLALPNRGRDPAKDGNATLRARCLGATFENGHCLGIRPVVQDALQYIKIGPGWQRLEKTLPDRGDPFDYASGLENLLGSSHRPREIDQYPPHG